MHNNWNKEPDYDLRWLVVAILVIAVAIFSKDGEARDDRFGNYNSSFNDIITMDVVKSGKVGGGTFRCPSVRSCYIYVLRAEARGANVYCESIKIKRNGNVVWWRKYQ